MLTGNLNNSLNMAKIEYDFGIVGSFYFRMTKKSYDLEVMEKFQLNHEIGYHYEDVDNALKYFKKRY